MVGKISVVESVPFNRGPKILAYLRTSGYYKERRRHARLDVGCRRQAIQAPAGCCGDPPAAAALTPGFCSLLLYYLAKVDTAPLFKRWTRKLESDPEENEVQISVVIPSWVQPVVE
jgi:hypothetical protein